MAVFTAPQNSVNVTCDVDVYQVTTTNGYLVQKFSAGASISLSNVVPFVLFADEQLSKFLCLAKWESGSNALVFTVVRSGVAELVTIDINYGGSVTAVPTSGATSVTINNGNNLKKVTVGETEYTNFPVSVSVSGGDTITGYGKDSPVITVDYLNTQEPVITDS